VETDSSLHSGAGGVPNVKNINGETALMTCCRHGQLEVMRLLLDGARVVHRDAVRVGVGPVGGVEQMSAKEPSSTSPKLSSKSMSGKGVGDVEEGERPLEQKSKESSS
jgi:ankyrin repeat protein